MSSRDLLDLPDIGDLLYASNCQTDDRADMTDVAFVFLRMLLVILWLCSVSHIFCDGADLIEPLALIIALVIASQITLQDLCCISVADLFRDLIGDLKMSSEEIADKIKDLLCINQVFSRLVARSSQIQDLCDIFLNTLKILQR